MSQVKEAMVALTSRIPKRVEGVVFVDPVTKESIKAPDPKGPKEADVAPKSKGTGMNPASSVQLNALADKFAK